MCCIVNLGYTVLMRPNRSKQSDQIVHGLPTQIQSEVHSLTTTQDTDTSNFNTSRICK